MLKQIVALTLVASLVLPGCTKLVRVQVDPRLTRVNLVELKIVGITTTAGEIVTFDRRGQTVLITTSGEILTFEGRGRTVLTTKAGRTVTYDRRDETSFTRDDVSAVEGYVDGERRRYSTTDISAVWIEKSKVRAGRTILAVLVVSTAAYLLFMAALREAWGEAVGAGLRGALGQPAPTPAPGPGTSS